MRCVPYHSMYYIVYTTVCIWYIVYVVLYTSWRRRGEYLGEDEFYEARGDTIELITGVVDVQRPTTPFLSVLLVPPSMALLDML